MLEIKNTGAVAVRVTFDDGPPVPFTAAAAMEVVELMRESADHCGGNRADMAICASGRVIAWQANAEELKRMARVIELGVEDYEHRVAAAAAAAE